MSASQPNYYNSSWIKTFRGPGEDLLNANKNAFILLFVIAIRARRTSKLNKYMLKVGEAMIGDHDKHGLTMSQYRAAKKFLQKHCLATFQATSRGTIATLTDSGVFDINEIYDDNQTDKQTATSQLTDNTRATTNKKEKNKKNGKKGKTPSMSPHPLDERKLKRRKAMVLRQLETLKQQRVDAKNAYELMLETERLENIIKELDAELDPEFSKLIAFPDQESSSQDDTVENEVSPVIPFIDDSDEPY